MADPYLSEIAMFGFNFAPNGWATCDGQVLAVSQNQALAALLQSNFGGSWPNTFALPNLQGRVAMGTGENIGYPYDVYSIGNNGGATAVTLSPTNLPPHSHEVQATTEPSSAVLNAGGAQFAASNNTALTPLYSNSASKTTLHSSTVGSFGGGAAHSNVQPYQTLLFCIATEGLWPSHQ